MPDPIEKIIRQIVSNHRLQARWLNTFSYLEYIGFRKIVKSQAAHQLSAETLAHAVEEGRHALRLKKAALKMGGEDFNRYSEDTLLCRRQAEHYFQALDKHCDSAFSGSPTAVRPKLVYLYVTWLVEARALTVYRIYQSLLPEKTGINFDGLLAEEKKHLDSVLSELERVDENFLIHAKNFQKVEAQLYLDYMNALQRELNREPSHVRANG